MKERKTAPNRGPKGAEGVEPPGLDFIKPDEAPKARPEKLENYSEQSLLALRAEIDQRLPPALLKDINLEDELVRQYQAVKALQFVVMADQDTPPNQKAQVANACAATLSQLTKMQADFYTSERFKAIEGVLIKCLKTLPDDTVAAFFTEYEAMST